MDWYIAEQSHGCWVVRDAIDGDVVRVGLSEAEARGEAARMSAGHRRAIHDLPRWSGSTLDYARALTPAIRGRQHGDVAQYVMSLAHRDRAGGEARHDYLREVMSHIYGADYVARAEATGLMPEIRAETAARRDAHYEADIADEMDLSGRSYDECEQEIRLRLRS